MSPVQSCSEICFSTGISIEYLKVHPSKHTANLGRRVDMNALFLADEIQILHKQVWRFSTLKLDLLIITIFVQIT